MQTSPILNTMPPVQTQAPKANETNASQDSPNSFNQVLSREMADRKAVNQAPKAKEPEAKSGTGQAAPEKTQEAKAAGDTETSTTATDGTADAQDDAVAATDDMLALVASLNQANPAAQASQQGAASAAQDAAALKTDVAADVSISAAKSAIDNTGAVRGRAATLGRVADPASRVKEAAPVAAVAAPQAQAVQAEDKTGAAASFARVLDKANTAADPADSGDAKPADITTAQSKPVANITTANKESATIAAARPEHAADTKDLPVTPATLQVQQQAAVNNLTHLAAPQAVESLAPRVGTPAWDQALGQKVTWMIAGEQQSASLTLNPPDLGPLQVVLNVTNSQANATFVAAQPEVRQALEAAMPRLRDMLSDAGIQLGQATVSSGSSGQQNAFDQQQSSSNARRTDIPGVRFDTPVQSGRVQPSSSGQGLVDTFV